MTKSVTPERVSVIAAAAQVPLRPDAPARIARAVTPTATRFASENISLAMETEPATFVVIARQGAKT